MPDGRIIRNASLKDFSELQSISPSVLLCEDSSDCSLFHAIAVAYLRKSNLSKAKIQFEHISGGGANTWITLKRYRDSDKRYVLCLVDNDKKPTSWKVGDTAKKIIRYTTSHPSIKIHHAVLDCHELENLAPDSLFEGVHHDLKVCCGQTGSRIAEIGRQGFHEIRFHLDIKKGLKLGDVFRLASNESSKDAWSPLLESIDQENFVFDDRWSSCLSRRRCTRAGPCSCVVLQPLGDNLLPIIEKIWARFGPETLRNLPKFLSDILSDIGILLISWGCASHPYRLVGDR